MHQQEKKSLKYWKQKKSNARTASSEQVRFSTPPGNVGFLGAKKKRASPGGGGVLTLLVEHGSTFSGNKNFSNTRILNQKGGKNNTLVFFPVSLWFRLTCVTN
jgi:hypothetical protein